MISTRCMSVTSAEMKCNLVGELTICDIAHAIKNAFGVLLRWLRLSPVDVLDVGGGQLALMCAKLWNDRGVAADLPGPHLSYMAEHGVETIHWNLCKSDRLLMPNSTSSFFLKSSSTCRYRVISHWNVSGRFCGLAASLSAPRQISIASETLCIWRWGGPSLTIFNIRMKKSLSVMCLNTVAIISIGSLRRPDSRNTAWNILRCTIYPRIRSFDHSLCWVIRYISFLAGATI